MPSPLILLLFVFWCYLAYQALQRGDVTRAVLYVVVGIGLSAWRLGRSRRRPTTPRPASSLPPTDLGR